MNIHQHFVDVRKELNFIPLGTEATIINNKVTCSRTAGQGCSPTLIIPDDDVIILDVNKTEGEVKDETKGERVTVIEDTQDHMQDIIEKKCVRLSKLQSLTRKLLNVASPCKRKAAESHGPRQFKQLRRAPSSCLDLD